MVQIMYTPQSEDQDMKGICVSVLLGLVSVSPCFAESWQKVLDCDNGAAVVDVNLQERKNLQLVIHDPRILQFLYSKGAIQLNYGDREAVIRGYQQNGVFQPSDFRGAGYRTNPRIVAFYRENAGLKFIVTEQSCWSEYLPGYEHCRENPLSMMCESAPQKIVCGQPREVANWYFQTCR